MGPIEDKTIAGSGQDGPNAAQARALLGPEPRRALDIATELLEAAPGSLEGRFLRGAALRRTGAFAEAREILVPLSAAHPKLWGLQFEAGAVLAMLGETEAALAALTRATALNPSSSLAWHALGDQLAIMGDLRGAALAHARPVAGAIGDAAFLDAARLLFDGQTDRALPLLRARFNLHLSDLTAVRMLADAGLRIGRPEAVDDFLAAFLSAAPRYLPLQQTRALVLYRLQNPAPALDVAERLLSQTPDAVSLQALRAALLVETGRYEAALDVYAELLERHPDQARIWLSYGHVLKTVGRQSDSIAAYRRSLALEPDLGEAYWSLANLKTVRFAAADLTRMRNLLDQPDLGDEDRVPLHFAVGKALEDDREYAASFAQYQRGNALRRAAAPHDANAHHDYARRTIATFTPAFFAARAGWGSPAPDPIFIVGLPRSGSTLVEQMLSSHSAVEGTAELPDLTALARGLARRSEVDGDSYPIGLGDLDKSVFAALGEDYLARTRRHRQSDRPYFIDKFPNNFLHIGLIHLILPQAKIIDARRHPMACCLSAFKQHFAQGQNYSYDLTDLGRFYADYAAMMAHFDQVLPGRVHRLEYEALIADPEGELQRLLDHCGLPFEPSCLRFHESTRPVRTASSEQVRRPISREGLDHWRHFAPWLEPLRAALGPVLAP
jgi:tetratricopeptide (TPR) repeat protein